MSHSEDNGLIGPLEWRPAMRGVNRTRPDRRDVRHRTLVVVEYKVYKEKEVLIMATSSITHNFVISDPQSVESFVTAIEEAERNRMPSRPPRGRLLTDSNDILALMSRRKANAKPVFHS